MCELQLTYNLELQRIEIEERRAQMEFEECKSKLEFDLRVLGINS